MSNRYLFQIEYTQENIDTYIESLNSTFPIELAELIESKPYNEKTLIFNALKPEPAVTVFEELSFPSQKEILQALSTEQATHLLNCLAPDDRTAFLERLPTSVVSRLLKFLSPEERALSIKLLGYPENSVGRLMTPDYLAIRLNWTVEKVLNYIREKGKDSETINVIYAVDDRGVLVDDFKIRQFLLASPEKKVEELSDNKFVALRVDDNEDDAINLFHKYGRVALPVIDREGGYLLGIVTFDDIMAAATRRDTEDMQKFAAVEAFEDPYMDIPLLNLVRKRVNWLVVLFLGEMLTASAMGFFEEEISKAVVLALFVPLIISSGGNAGSQASTLIIRALSLGEITLRDWAKVMRRELYAGLFLGSVLGVIGFLRVSLWSAFSTIYGAHWVLVAITLLLTLIGVVLWGALVGAMLPFILKWCGMDPAVSSAPFVATLVDVTGLIIYFTIAMIILRGSLL